MSSPPAAKTLRPPSRVSGQREADSTTNPSGRVCSLTRFPCTKTRQDEARRVGEPSSKNHRIHWSASFSFDSFHRVSLSLSFSLFLTCAASQKVTSWPLAVTTVSSPPAPSPVSSMEVTTAPSLVSQVLTRFLPSPLPSTRRSHVPMPDPALAQDAYTRLASRRDHPQHLIALACGGDSTTGSASGLVRSYTRRNFSKPPVTSLAESGEKETQRTMCLWAKA
mmetsp:Transcript_11967/g.30334  ORF Transcript_11967/g.30334 Transcript_11967/m.30334 type:complete len:222 (-) Transcript_11967:375-1040(-)